MDCEDRPKRLGTVCIPAGLPGVHGGAAAIDESLVRRHGVDTALDRLGHAVNKAVHVIGRNLVGQRVVGPRLYPLT